MLATWKEIFVISAYHCVPAGVKRGRRKQLQELGVTLRLGVKSGWAFRKIPSSRSIWGKARNFI